MVCLLPVLSLQLHRYPKCIAKGQTPGGGVNAIDGLSCSTVVFLLNLFVTAHVDDILNTDSNKQYSVTVIYQIYKYIFYKVHIKTFKRRFPVVNGTVLALRVRDVGFDSHRLHFLFIFYFLFLYFYYLFFYYFLFIIILLFYLECKTTEPSCRFVSDS